MFITNQCALLLWGTILLAILFMIKMEDDPDLSYDSIQTTYPYSPTDQIYTLQLNAAWCLSPPRLSQIITIKGTIKCDGLCLVTMQRDPIR